MRTRRNEIKIRLDDQELSRLDAMVAKTVQSREGFIRQMLAGYQLVEAPSEDVRELVRQITRLGTNINVMFRNMTFKGFVSQDQFLKAADELWEARDMINSLFRPYHMKRSIMREEADDG